jgi:hypothetical protein
LKEESVTLNASDNLSIAAKIKISGSLTLYAPTHTMLSSYDYNFISSISFCKNGTEKALS